jgi:hypothetical protein
MCSSLALSSHPRKRQPFRIESVSPCPTITFKQSESDWPTGTQGQARYYGRRSLPAGISVDQALRSTDADMGAHDYLYVNPVPVTVFSVLTAAHGPCAFTAVGALNAATGTCCSTATSGHHSSLSSLKLRGSGASNAGAVNAQRQTTRTWIGLKAGMRRHPTRSPCIDRLRMTPPGTAARSHPMTIDARSRHAEKARIQPKSFALSGFEGNRPRCRDRSTLRASSHPKNRL